MDDPASFAAKELKETKISAYPISFRMIQKIKTTTSTRPITPTQMPAAKISPTSSQPVSVRAKIENIKSWDKGRFFMAVLFRREYMINILKTDAMQDV